MNLLQPNAKQKMRIPNTTLVEEKRSRRTGTPLVRVATTSSFAVADNQSACQAFVRSGKSLIQLEEEMLNGQKLQVRNSLKSN